MLYDAESNILSVELSRDAIADTKVVGNLIIHISSVGKPVLIEILDASKLIGKKEKLPGLGQLRNLIGEA
jgi:uncharacterized protein YuzE